MNIKLSPFIIVIFFFVAFITFAFPSDGGKRSNPPQTDRCDGCGGPDPVNCGTVDNLCPAYFSGCGPGRCDVEVASEVGSYFICNGTGYGSCSSGGSHGNDGGDGCNESCEGHHCYGDTGCGCTVSACYCTQSTPN